MEKGRSRFTVTAWHTVPRTPAQAVPSPAAHPTALSRNPKRIGLGRRSQAPQAGEPLHLRRSLPSARAAVITTTNAAAVRLIVTPSARCPRNGGH